MSYTKSYKVQDSTYIGTYYALNLVPWFPWQGSQGELDQGAKEAVKSPGSPDSILYKWNSPQVSGSSILVIPY